MAYLALDRVSVAIHALLNVAGLTDISTGGVSAMSPQGTEFPYTWFELRERDQRGFGTGGFPEVELRVHAFSATEGPYEAHRMIQKAIELLRDQPLTVTGYAQAGRVFYDETMLLQNELVHGKRVHEAVAIFRVYAEETGEQQPLPWIQSGWAQ